MEANRSRKTCRLQNSNDKFYDALDELEPTDEVAFSRKSCTVKKNCRITVGESASVSTDRKIGKYCFSELEGSLAANARDGVRRRPDEKDGRKKTGGDIYQSEWGKRHLSSKPGLDVDKKPSEGELVWRGSKEKPDDAGNSPARNYSERPPSEPELRKPTARDRTSFQGDDNIRTFSLESSEHSSELSHVESDRQDWIRSLGSDEEYLNDSQVTIRESQPWAVRGIYEVPEPAYAANSEDDQPESKDDQLGSPKEEQKPSYRKEYGSLDASDEGSEAKPTKPRLASTAKRKSKSAPNRSSEESEEEPIRKSSVPERRIAFALGRKMEAPSDASGEDSEEDPASRSSGRGATPDSRAKTSEAGDSRYGRGRTQPEYLTDSTGRPQPEDLIDSRGRQQPEYSRNGRGNQQPDDFSDGRVRARPNTIKDSRGWPQPEDTIESRRGPQRESPINGRGRPQPRELKDARGRSIGEDSIGGRSWPTREDLRSGRGRPEDYIIEPEDSRDGGGPLQPHGSKDGRGRPQRDDSIDDRDKPRPNDLNDSRGRPQLNDSIDGRNRLHPRDSKDGRGRPPREDSVDRRDRSQPRYSKDGIGRPKREDLIDGRGKAHPGYTMDDRGRDSKGLKLRDSRAPKHKQRPNTADTKLDEDSEPTPSGGDDDAESSTKDAGPSKGGKTDAVKEQELAEKPMKSESKPATKEPAQKPSSSKKEKEPDEESPEDSEDFELWPLFKEALKKRYPQKLIKALVFFLIGLKIANELYHISVPLKDYLPNFQIKP